VFVLLFTAVFAPLVFADQAGAASAIASAKQEIVSCFEAARAAEAAGVNISGLTAVLNDAGALLSDAELAYSKGDFDVAQGLAVQCREGLVDFVSEANKLTVDAAEAKTNDFLINVAGSSAGVVVVLAVSVWVWFFVKKRYAPRGEKQSWRQTN